MNYHTKNVRLFLCGDVMIGRGIDQILPFPSNPLLYESYVKDARDYVLLAEQKNSTIMYPVAMDYIWGDALSIWHKYPSDIKIINLETAITISDEYWPSKGINYRMHPKNIDILKTAGIDVCTLANNHILDWGYSGLTETLQTLKNANIKYTGAGTSLTEAMQPAVIQLHDDQRILVFSVGTDSSGVPSNWLANQDRSGIFYLDQFNRNSIDWITNHINQFKKTNDLVIFSIHWGSNWGYDISKSFQWFAHELIDKTKVDVIFGHSSHHFRPIEMYHDKPIFYGCGDFMNDYEGISGHEEFRSDLTLMYFIEFDQTKQFIQIIMIPMQIKNFSLQKVCELDYQWIFNVLNQFKLNSPYKLIKQADHFVMTAIK